MEDNNILAVVLAGGKSKRFGKDKNHVKLGDKTLLEHVLSKISNKFKEILIVSSHIAEIKKNENITIIPDCYEDLGPLAGVLSSMKWIKKKQKKYKWVATFPSDTPFFETSIILSLANGPRSFTRKIIDLLLLIFVTLTKDGN